jgi:hypothetical protein
LDRVKNQLSDYVDWHFFQNWPYLWYVRPPDGCFNISNKNLSFIW